MLKAVLQLIDEFSADDHFFLLSKLSIPPPERPSTTSFLLATPSRDQRFLAELTICQLFKE
jgi:hypothetical protein